MQTTERIRPMGLAGESVRNLPVVLVSLFIAIAAVDVLLVTQPALVYSLRDDWQSWVDGSVVAPWATLVGATASVACVAVAAAVLTVVVRGIVDAPYLWLASALVAGCCFAISRMTVEVPVHIPTPMFAVMSALLLMGGGAFFQSRSMLLNMVGTFLAAIPLSLLGVGYARGRTSTGAAYAVDSDAQLLLTTLLIASVGTLLVAVASRRLRALGGAAALGAPSAEQLAELIDRARSGERRAAEAENRLQLLTRHAGGVPRLNDDYELSQMRGSGFGRLAFWVFTTLVVAGGAIGFFGGYLPLQQQLATQQRLNHEQAQKHEAAVSKLRADFSRERDELQRPAGASAPIPDAVSPGVPDAQPTQPKLEAPAKSPRTGEVRSEPASPAARVEAPKAHRAVEAAAAAPKRAVRPAAAPAARPGAPAAKPERAAPPEPQRQQPHSPVSRGDDPLEGLDGI